MAPRKSNVGTKSDFALRASVPLGQKLPASDVNDIVAAINANYERLMFDWTADIMDGFQLIAGMYVFFSGAGYRIKTSYNVGVPKTWIGANAEPLFPASSASLGSLEVSVSGATINLDFNNETDRVFYGDLTFGSAKTIALVNATNARRLDFAFSINNVAAALTWPSNFFMQATPQWASKVWTPDYTGDYLARAVRNPTADKWLLTIELPYI